MSETAKWASVECVQLQCYKCAIVFYMPQDMNERCRQDGGNFYCPNGHSQVYTTSEVTRLKRQLDEQQARTTEEWNRANAAERKAATANKKLGRVSKGICPECKRSFANLRRHMECKHGKKKP